MIEAVPTSVSTEICRFVAGLNFADLPKEVRLKAKLHILDALGCGIAGASSTLAQSMLDYLKLEHVQRNVPVFGSPLQFGPAAAAFGNSAAMNALDFDDGFEVDGKGMGHPGATIVAAAASAPFEIPVDGKSFLTGVVAGYEVNSRLIKAIQPSISRFREVYGVCQHQSVGAAFAYGKILGLDASHLENALGLAATLTNVASLRKYNFGTRPLISFKDFNAPAAESGVRAVQLNSCGVVGSRDVLDGPTGFWRMLGSDLFQPDHLTVGLGTNWAMLDSSFKAYPACRWMHTAMEAFETLMLDNDLRPEMINEVIVHTSEGLTRDFMDPAPATMVDAQFSFPYALAALIYGVRPAAAWYQESTLKREDLRLFAKRVRAQIDSRIDAFMRGPLRRPAGRVSIVYRDNLLHSSLIEFALGTRERPLNEERVVAKFFENSTPVIGADKATALQERVLNIEREVDMSVVLKLATTCA